MNKEQLFRELYKSDIKRQDYFDAVPSDLKSVLMNAYNEYLLDDRYMLIQFAFGEHAYSVEWFLNEWRIGYEVGLSEGEQTPIYSIDDMIEWMKKNEGFE